MNKKNKKPVNTKNYNKKLTDKNVDPKLKGEYAVYLKKIDPLILKIEAICKKHNIPWLSNFFVAGRSITNSQTGGHFNSTLLQDLALGILCPDVPEAIANAQIAAMKLEVERALKQEALQAELLKKEEIKTPGDVKLGVDAANGESYTGNLAECGCEICTREFEEPKAPPPVQDTKTDDISGN